MDIVLCHQTADFDTLGAAVGVTCLHPGTRMVLCGGAHPTVRDFLALYRDQFPLIERRSINKTQLRSVTVVDAQQQDRFGPAAPWLTLPQVKLKLYDHHLQTNRDIEADEQVVEAVGATTTLIAEELQSQHIQLSAAVATVMALGIHVDTGSLTYQSTTVRDAAALTWLMAQGANQRAIATYTEPVFSADLPALLGQALDHLQTQSIHGHTLAWVILSTAGYIPGLSSLTSQLMHLSESDCLLLANIYGEASRQRLSIIGRSRIDGVDLNTLLQPLGGGGHARAAAATLRTENPEGVVAERVDALTQQIPLPPKAADLMSSPVRTIRPTTTIDQARRILLRYGHSGLSVVNDQDQLEGILSRRDLDIALHHGFGHAPVKGYMTAPVRTIQPETLLPDIEMMMVTYDIGRLPVVDQGQLVGIVTRTDILRQLHQLKQVGSPTHRRVVRTSIQDQLRSQLSPLLHTLLTTAAAAAADQGWQLYLVGGAVRDLLLAGSDQPYRVREFDLVVDGVATTAAGVALAQTLQQAYPETQLQVYGQFQTAALIWPAGSELAGFSVDIATARSEFYPYPAANPEVEASSIRQDLYRRDFTINALAVRLTHQGHQQQPELLDFFGGSVDLSDRQIRVLHPNSFIEDPTRIFRAVRFATRLGFAIGEQTEAYIRHAIASGIYAQVQAEEGKAPALQSRLQNELKYIFKTPQWVRALSLLANLDALQCIHPQLQIDRHGWRRMYLANRWQTLFDPQQQHMQPWLLILETLIAVLPTMERSQVATNLHLPELSQQRLHKLDPLLSQLSDLAANAAPSQIAALLTSYDIAQLILVAAYSTLRVRQWLWHYLQDWSTRKPLLTGKDLIQLGYQPGRQFKSMLAAIWAATLDGELQHADQARHWVQQQFPLSRS
ncbi:CBS domain-containing protein [Acaryochloris sp. IP29b_bin.148]|uniref:CBS domain-containing protein n=1 Tax=Acaryochloris sp. IP29b_bin.148 TaxID=2969218 RepID=UPI002617D428|nr:CBS domain-containing protein [Acaryochloris sp. IP29b_bin.148]